MGLFPVCSTFYFARPPFWPAWRFFGAKIHTFFLTKHEMRVYVFAIPPGGEQKCSILYLPTPCFRGTLSSCGFVLQSREFHRMFAKEGGFP